MQESAVLPVAALAACTVLGIASVSRTSTRSVGRMTVPGTSRMMSRLKSQDLIWESSRSFIAPVRLYTFEY